MTWEELDGVLFDLAGRAGARVYHLSDAGRYQLSPSYRYGKTDVDRLTAAYRQLCREFGEGFLRRGKGDRSLQVSPVWSFAADVLLGSYLLVLLFDGGLNHFVVRRELDKAKPELESMIRRLPPLDGGGRTIAKGMPTSS